ncbi:MAG TPA: AAA family ATPase, partial [Flavobacteriaceae bacterium]|nr:AAA family ATPase [Flavobacteriaceae bacterium]
MSKVKIKILDNMSLQNLIDGDAELIPLMSEEDEAIMNKEETPKVLPILPLRNTVLFPGVVIPITAGRDSSIKLISDANKGNKTIGVVSQINEEVEAPTIDDIHKIGTVAKILKVLKLPDGNTMVVIQGQKRFEVEAFVQDKPYIKATTKTFDEQRYDNDKEFNAIINEIRELSIKIIDENPQIPSEASGAIKNIKSNAFLIDFVSSNMHLDVAQKQELLNIKDQKERALVTLKKMTKELQRLELRNDIQSKVREDMDKQQRDYFLNQQMKTIQEELGGVSYDEEIEEMKEKAKKKKWSKEIAEIFEKELGRLQRMNPQVAEYSVQRNYLDLFLDLPWNEFTKDVFDLKKASEILDREHFGLEKVKKRILEYLAVLKLKNDMKSPILCLYGPPGTGKTSLGKSIAEAVGRKYVRLSLGGLRDESEIRGHRKTYIGAMPGRIIKSIQKAKTSNPLIVLDEIDKLASNTHNGSPSSAMLEVLDPEQN